MISGVVVGVMFLLIYHEQYGIANYILQTLPLFKPIGWLSDRRFALFSIILADVWQQTPFVILLLLAGLDAMPREPYEASIIDGANKWQIFRFITLPLLRSVIYVALTLRLVVSLRVFDKVFLLTRGGPGTSTYILNLLGYEKALRHFKCGEATALVILIIILTLSVVFIIFKRAFAE